MQILEGNAELEILPTLRSVIILPPSQPRFLARLPRWQLVLHLLNQDEWSGARVLSVSKVSHLAL